MGEAQVGLWVQGGHTIQYITVYYIRWCHSILTYGTTIVKCFPAQLADAANGNNK